MINLFENKFFFGQCLVASAGILPFQLFSVSQAAESKSPARTNIVFILVDDMGIGDCSVYNPDSKISTPNIDRLASEGIRFTDAHAAGAISVPSRYGLITGQYPMRTWDKFPPNQPSISNPKQATIASVLKNGGYETAMVGKWHLGIQYNKNNSKDLKVKFSPVEFGFDYFFGINQSLDTQPYFYVENDHMVAAPIEHIKGQEGDPGKVSRPSIQGPMWREGSIAPGFVHSECLPFMTSKSIDYISSRSPKGNPFFLYVALPAPHAPWLPQPKFRGKSGAGDYGDYMMQVDDCVGKILAVLKQKGLEKNTLVIFTSDNGPLWFPEDVKMYGHHSAGIYKGMKLSMYEGGHREPFIARWPGKVKAGSVSDQMINFTDMMATFADIAGTKLSEGVGNDSFSMLPFLLDITATKPIRTDNIHEHYGNDNSLAYRNGDWKLILPYNTYQVFNRSIKPEEIVSIEKFELYNLRNDPSEKNNLVNKMPEKVLELFKKLKTNIEKGNSRS